MKHRTTLFRHSLLAALLTTGGLTARAQNVGIGTTAPDASAALDIVASAKGALLPRVTAAGRTGIPSPATGLIVFQTDGTSGFYYNSGTPGAPVWQQIATAAGTATGFIQNQNAADQVANFRISGTGTAGTRLGAGTTAPQLGLDAAGGASSIGLRNSAAWDHMYLFHDGSTAYLRAGGAETGLSLQVGTSATGTYGDPSQSYLDVMRLLPNGNVGIGTTAPTDRLHVTSTGIPDLRLRLAATDNVNVGTLYKNSNSEFFTGFTFPGTANATDYTIYNNLTNRALLDIQPGGNVGIGTIAPSQKLSVNGGVQAAGFGAFTGSQPNDQGAHLQWNRTGGEGETWLINHMGLGTANAGIRFAGITTGTGTAPTEWARFLNNGNFGIGTTAPSQKLDVAGNARIQGLTTAGVVTTDAAGNLSSGTAASLDPTTASNGLTKVGSDFRLGGTLSQATTIGLGANSLSFTSTTGTVGIGATSAARLHVRGTGNAFPATTGTVQSVGLISRFQTSDNAILDLGGNSGNGFWLQSTDITTLGLNYPLLLNPNGGNVGIGTTAPAQKLDVVGNIQSSANIAVDYTNANAGTVANTLHFGPTNSGEAIGSKRTATGNQFGLDFYTTSTARMSINSAGNVGIGTTNPQFPLQVAGGAVSSGTGSFLGFFDRTDATKLYNWYATGGRSTLNLTTVGVGNVDLFTVTNAGRVGISTTAPNSLLDLGTGFGTAASDIATKKLAIYNNAAGTDFYGFGVSTGQLNFFINSNATAVSAPTMTMTSTGLGIGLGNSSPVAGLHVDRPQGPSASGLGVILSGGTSGNPSIELRGNGAVPFIDFVETVGIDNSTRLISQGGTLNVQTSVANATALAVNGFIELDGVNAGASPAIAMAKVISTIPGAANSQVIIALPTGVTRDKVLSLTGMAGQAGNDVYPPNNGITTSGNAHHYQLYINNNNIIINTDNNSSALFNAPVRILITYEK